MCIKKITCFCADNNFCSEHRRHGVKFRAISYARTVAYSRTPNDLGHLWQTGWTTTIHSNLLKTGAARRGWTHPEMFLNVESILKINGDLMDTQEKKNLDPRIFFFIYGIHGFDLQSPFPYIIRAHYCL